MMTRIFGLILVVMMLLSSFAYADQYTAEEIIPSIVSFTDEELEMVLEAVTAEQNLRSAALLEEERAIKAAEQEAILEEEEYIERPLVQRGDKGDEAKVVQERLIELGFLVGTADGDFGKKSEAAVKLFQKANGLEETGIADSMTRHVMHSARVIDKEAYDNMPIAVGDGWEIIKEYYYNTKWDNNYIFILKNTIGYTAHISVNVYFYDVDNNLVGVANASEYACESGHLSYWSFSNDDIDFDHVGYEITMSEDTYYQGGQSSLEIGTNVVGEKVIISAKNIGTKPVEFAEYHVLFFNENGEVIRTGWGYLTDDDSEIKPGATEMREENAYDAFADVRVIVSGRIDD